MIAVGRSGIEHYRVAVNYSETFWVRRNTLCFHERLKRKNIVFYLFYPSFVIAFLSLFVPSSFCSSKITAPGPAEDRCGRRAYVIRANARDNRATAHAKITSKSGCPGAGGERNKIENNAGQRRSARNSLGGGTNRLCVCT